MTRLFSADRMRLRKSWLFALVLVITAVISLQIFQEEHAEALYYVQEGASWAMDEAFLQFSILNGMLLAAFLPLHLGVDFSDGTIRNKLIAGHWRSSIYLSMLMTALLSAAIMAALCLTVNTATGLLTGGRIAMTWRQFALSLLSAICASFAFASLYVLLSTLIPNRAFSAVACIAAFMLMSFLSGAMERMLVQAEIARDVVDFVNGQPVWGEPYANPHYVSGWKRTALELLIDFLPTGQGTQMSNLEADRVGRFPWLSTLFILLTSSIGLLGFRKKDLK